MVVEKTFAKLHGSWEAIGKGGRISAALQALTGGVGATQHTKILCWDTLMDAVEDLNVLVGAGTKHHLDVKVDQQGIFELTLTHAYGTHAYGTYAYETHVWHTDI